MRLRLIISYPITNRQKPLLAIRGTFDVRARDINEEMKLAAANALASLVSDDELSDVNILPAAFDPRCVEAVSAAVKECYTKG